MTLDMITQFVYDNALWIGLSIAYPIWYALGAKIGRLIRSKRKKSRPKIIVRHLHNGVVQRAVEVDAP